MSYLGLLAGQGGTAPVTPTPPPPLTAEPFRLLSLAQTVDAPVVARALTTAPLTDAALVPGQTVPNSSLRLIGSDKSMDIVYRYEAHSYEWRTDAAECALRIKASGAADNMRAYRVYVDGAPATDDYIRQDADAQVRVPLGAAGTWRTVRVDLSSVTLAGVDVPTGAQVHATGQRKRLYVLGDSWTAGASYRPKAGGTGTENGPGIEHMAFLTTRLLNAEMYLGGIGGTGYKNGDYRNPPNHYGSTQRLDRLVASKPDVVLVFGSINDNNSDGAGLGQYATDLYSRLAADLPGVPVLVCGVQDWGQAFSGTDSSPEMTRAVAAAPNVKGYVQPLVEDWVPTGDTTINNEAYNRAHLTVYGNRYYAEKLAAFIAKSLNIPAA